MPERHLEENNLLCTAQNGFRNVGKRNCPDHLYTLIETLKNRKRRKQRTLGFFLDFSKAFDMTNHSLVEFKLRKKGVKGKMLRTIRSLMAGMNAIATEQGKQSEPFKLQRGTAQGCPLSPTLFDVFIDDLVEKLHKNKKGINEVSVLAYADDILTLAATPEELQEQVNICAEWTANWRMKANAKKSQVMAWDVPAGPKTELNITLNGTALKQVECYEYLGIKVDTELKFKAHEIGKLHGAKAKLGAIKQLIRENYVPRKMKQQLVNSVVLQGPYYGLPFWGDDKPKVLDKLIKEPCKVIAGVNNKFRANPYAAMAIAGIKPANVQLLETTTRMLGCIRNHDPGRLSKQTYQRDCRNDTLKTNFDQSLE